MPELNGKGSTGKTPNRLVSALGIVVVVLALEGIAVGIWIKARPEPPKTVLMQDFNDLQADFTSTQAKLKASLQQYNQIQARCTSLQRQNAGLSQRLSQLISPETLPPQVRSQSNDNALAKIQALCQARQQLNSRNVGALLSVFQELQSKGVINTGLAAPDEKRQALYTQIQILLQAIKVLDGPINGQGPDTLRAVKRFQAQRQLKVDGKIGMKTFSQVVAKFKQNCLADPLASPVKLAASPAPTKPRRTRPSRARR